MGLQVNDIKRVSYPQLLTVSVYSKCEKRHTYFMFFTEILTQCSFTYMIIRPICTVNFHYNLTTHMGNNFFFTSRE